MRLKIIYFLFLIFPPLAFSKNEISPSFNWEGVSVTLDSGGTISIHGDISDENSINASIYKTAINEGFISLINLFKGFDQLTPEICERLKSKVPPKELSLFMDNKHDYASYLSNHNLQVLVSKKINSPHGELAIPGKHTGYYILELQSEKTEKPLYKMFYYSQFAIVPRIGSIGLLSYVATASTGAPIPEVQMEALTMQGKTTNQYIHIYTGATNKDGLFSITPEEVSSHISYDTYFQDSNCFLAQYKGETLVVPYSFFSIDYIYEQIQGSERNRTERKNKNPGIMPFETELKFQDNKVTINLKNISDKKQSIVIWNRYSDNSSRTIVVPPHGSKEYLLELLDTGDDVEIISVLDGRIYVKEIRFVTDDSHKAELYSEYNSTKPVSFFFNDEEFDQLAMPTPSPPGGRYPTR